MAARVWGLVPRVWGREPIQTLLIITPPPPPQRGVTPVRQHHPHSHRVLGGTAGSSQNERHMAAALQHEACCGLLRQQVYADRRGPLPQRVGGGAADKQAERSPATTFGVASCAVFGTTRQSRS